MMLITDDYEKQDELFDVYEMLDPLGKYSSELEDTFKNIEYIPRNELISKILKHI